MSKDEIQFIRDFLKNLSPRLILSLKWKEISKSIFQNLKKISNLSSKDTLENQFNTKHFRLLIEKKGKFYPLILKEIQPLKRKLFYNELVHLYFIQIFHDRPFYFNFLESFFYINKEPDIFYFKPLTGFFHGSSLDKKFKKGLNELYTGLYEKDQEITINGLINLGLLSELKEATSGIENQKELKKRKELIRIVESHFGSNTQNYFFKLNHLTSTMEKVISFVNKYKIKLDSNFILFSLCLTSLYLCLKESKEGINLEEIYFKIKS